MATTQIAEGFRSLQEMCLELSGRLGKPFTDDNFRYLLRKQRLAPDSFRKVGWYWLFSGEDVSRVERAARGLKKYQSVAG